MYVFRLQVGCCWLLVGVVGECVLSFSMAGAFEIASFDFNVGESNSVVYIVSVNSISRSSRTR